MQALLDGFRTCIWVPLPENWEEAVDPTTKKVYYYNRKTGTKSWNRPDAIACAHVTAYHATTAQPKRVMPRRTSSTAGLEAAAVLNNTAVAASASLSASDTSENKAVDNQAAA